MALALNDRVQQTGTANTTVSFTLSGSVTGFQSFAVVGNGNTTYYAATDASGNWESGIGTYSTTGPTLTRTTILSSSNSNTAVTFSGTVNVFVTYPSSKSVNLDGSSNVSALGTISSGTWNGSTIAVAYGGTGVTASSGANSVMLRDANQNVAVNRLNQSNTSISASGGTTALTAASSYSQTLNGTGNQTYTMPDATTLTTGVAFVFNNNATGTLTLQDYSTGPIGTITSGGAVELVLLANGTVAGTWDVHGFLPEAVTWGTNALNLGTTVITNGTWNGGTIGTAYGGTGLTTFAAANSALYSTSSSALAAGTLPIAAGGTAATTFTANGVLYGNGTSALGVTAAGTTGQVLIGNTSGAPTWGTLSNSAVTSFQTSLSGLTPSTATTGAVTLAGTLGVTSGGTGTSTASAAFNALSPLTTSGDILYGATSGAGTRLGIGTTGQVLTVVGGLPAWSNAGAGTVTSVSVVSANGFAGTVATATTTPAITLTTSITGVLKGNATAISAATSGTDYSAGTSSLATGILKSTTTTGALSIAVAADFPTLNQNTTGTAANVTGTVAVANGGTNQTSYTDGQLLIGNTTGNTLAKATLTAGTGISVTNGAGSITIANSAPSIAWQSVQTGNFSATTGNGYPVNTTSGAITVTLPASPSAGNIITLTDYAGTWQTNNVTLNLNGNKFNSTALNAILSTKRQSISIVYIDATQGWLAYNGFLDSISAQNYTASYLIVAGGGGGGSNAGGYNSGGGGGGAGGLLSGTSSITLGVTYSVTVGSGGAGTTAGTPAAGGSGTDSTFNAITSIGGGGGGKGAASATNGVAGGSGGGGGATAGTGGSATSGQGFAGGSGASGAVFGGGGGGGAGAVGGNSTTNNGGNGGIGVQSSITGTATYYGGGGGAGSYGATAGTGGSGGGGAGGVGAVANGTAGTVNTGGGGGGGGSAGATGSGGGGAGGSGVVILSVPTTNYSGTTTGSPTITTSGSNTIISFTASGTYTA